MAQLRQDFENFKVKDVVILVVGPENARAFESYWESHQLPFVGLPDPRGSVLRLYGQEVNLFKLGRMPAQMLIDMEGKVRFVHYGQAMQDIPENQEILDLVELLARSEKQGMG